MCLTPEQRGEWAARRGFAPEQWWNNVGATAGGSDLDVGAGDWAEAVSQLTTGEISVSEGPPLTQEDLDRVRAWLASCPQR